MTVKIDRYKIFENGTTGMRIYDFLIAGNIVFLSTDDKELNKSLAELVLNRLNEME